MSTDWTAELAKFDALVAGNHPLRVIVGVESSWGLGEVSDRVTAKVKEQLGVTDERVKISTTAESVHMFMLDFDLTLLPSITGATLQAMKDQPGVTFVEVDGIVHAF